MQNTCDSNVFGSFLESLTIVSKKAAVITISALLFLIKEVLSFWHQTLLE